MNGLEMKYFVLNPTKDDEYGEASRFAILAYSNYIRQHNPELANNIDEWILKLSNAARNA